MANPTGAEKGTSSSSSAEETRNVTAEVETKTLADLLKMNLQDVYSAESQLEDALPQLIKATDSEELQEELENFMELSHKHVARIEKVYQYLELKGKEKCEAMEGLIKECKQVISDFPLGAVRDASLIIGIQKMCHYQIASYGSICELSDVLGNSKVCNLLDRTLEEVEATDEALTRVAKSINDEACREV